MFGLEGCGELHRDSEAEEQVRIEGLVAAGREATNNDRVTGRRVMEGARSYGSGELERQGDR